MNLSVVIVPAKVLADGTHKVRIAMSHNCETRYKVTRFVVPSPKNVKNGRVVGKDIANAEYINTQLNGIVQRMYRAFDAIPNPDCYTCKQLLDLIEAKMNVVIPVTFDEIAEEWLNIKAKKCKDGSMDIFRKSVSCFMDYKGEGFLLSTLSVDAVNGYCQYLKNSYAKKKNNEELGHRLSPSTINMRVRVLKDVVSYAERRKYVSFDVDPFVDYTPLKERIRDVFLPVEVMRKIRNFQSDDENVMIARDIFLLSFYLGGMNLEDILSIDFRGDDISFMRGKTKMRRLDGRNTEFAIQPEAREIIERYMIYHNGRLVFASKRNKHTLSNYFDRHFRKLIESIGYSGRAIFYSARKSFAQYAYLLHIQEMVIRYCIGDALTSKEKDMLVYYTKTEKRMADEAIRSVIDFLNSELTEDDVIQGRR